MQTEWYVLELQVYLFLFKTAVLAWVYYVLQIKFLYFLLTFTGHNMLLNYKKWCNLSIFSTKNRKN